MIIVAIVRGRPGEIVLADLEFALRRIESISAINSRRKFPRCSMNYTISNK